MLASQLSHLLNHSEEGRHGLHLDPAVQSELERTTLEKTYFQSSTLALFLKFQNLTSLL